MHFTTTAAVLGALSTMAAAQDIPGMSAYASVSNYCDFPTFTWYVGTNVSTVARNPAQVGYVGEVIISDPETGGRAIKIFTEEDGLYSGAAHLNLAYNFEDPLVWYDMSEVFGSPFEGHKLRVTAHDEGCEDYDWEDGVQPAGSNLQVCEAKKGFSLTLCAGSDWDPSA
ncbi:hypothetical protein IMZ48_35390 [Candidatus Bathyarchaeota archaeon]|nr:hypothetical protein [Candidatus Bathyarchaeota archaeon]